MSYLIKVICGITAIVATASTYANNDENNYLGDKLDFTFNVRAKYLDGDQEYVCIPAGTQLRGLKSGDPAVLYAQTIKSNVTSCDEPPTTINTARVLAIARDTEPLKSAEPNRSGTTFGALVVPFKYYYSGTKEFTGSTTVGPYFGYRTSKSSWGWGLKYIVFLGATSVPVAQDVNGQSTTQNLAGFSYGVGLLGEIKQDFKLGFVIGVDNVRESSQFQNNGVPWVAFSLNYEFAK